MIWGNNHFPVNIVTSKWLLPWWLHSIQQRWWTEIDKLQVWKPKREQGVAIQMEKMSSFHCWWVLDYGKIPDSCGAKTHKKPCKGLQLSGFIYVAHRKTLSFLWRLESGVRSPHWGCSNKISHGAHTTHDTPTKLLTTCWQRSKMEMASQCSLNTTAYT